MAWVALAWVAVRGCRGWRIEQGLTGFPMNAVGGLGKTQCFELILADVQLSQFGLTCLDGSPAFEVGGRAFFFLPAIFSGAAIYPASALDTHIGAGNVWEWGVSRLSTAGGGVPLRQKTCDL